MMKCRMLLMVVPLLVLGLGAGGCAAGGGMRDLSQDEIVRAGASVALVVSDVRALSKKEGQTAENINALLEDLDLLAAFVAPDKAAMAHDLIGKIRAGISASMTVAAIMKGNEQDVRRLLRELASAPGTGAPPAPAPAPGT